MRSLLALAVLIFSTAALAESPAEKLVRVLNSREMVRPYYGNKVTIDAKDLPLVDFFRVYAEANGFKVTASEKAAAVKVKVAVRDLPWDQALDIVLQMHGLKATLKDGAVRIVTLDEFNKALAGK